jgi:aminoglycoside 2'-N-acetyltransferase I
VTDVRLAHTADLAAATLTTVRALLDHAFDEMAADDWEHALGGMHALIWEGAELVGHGSVVQRRLLTGGRALRTGYVEAVAVRPDRQGRGYGAAMMAALERVIHSAYDLGALTSSQAGVPLYHARGWQLWQGPFSVLRPNGITPSPDVRGAVFVLPTQVPLDLTSELTCDWRDGDPW